MVAKTKTSGLTYADLRKRCMEAARQWPGCQTVSGIQIVRQNDGKFSIRVTLYGNTEKRLADRAMNAVEREMRRHFHLVE